MLDQVDENSGFSVASFQNPFKRVSSLEILPAGINLQTVVENCHIRPEMRPYIVVRVSVGTTTSEVPEWAWQMVRPKPGTIVEIYPIVEGPAIGGILMAVVGAAAPAIAGALFPSLTGFALSLATAAISVVGMLIVRAIVPPAKQQSSQNDDPVYTLSGASNAAAPYDPYPTVLGRHIMFPKKTATGYTETVEDEIYLRERMTFGYGPVALETLKIGTTPITEFEGVEIEFLNVDRALTVAAMPELAGTTIKVVGWRYGTQALTLYPDDISEDSYSVLLEQYANVTRQTRLNTRSAQVDIAFQGLCRYSDSGSKEARTVDVLIEYRRIGTSTWVAHENKICTESTTSYVRFTSNITFPVVGQYDVRVTRQTADSTDTKVQDKANLTAIRSVQSGSLPSHQNIAEIAIRIKATNELNGQIESLNSIVQQLAPVWTGSTWTSPQPIRHPAWVYARAMMGPMMKDPVPDHRLDLTELKAWADAEPHWTCDTVIEGVNRLADVLDIVCAAGRARRGLVDLKYSVIRDGGAGGIVQHFTPRNSWGFVGQRFLDRPIHAFRVRIVSERKEWAQDEILVYADGYNASNATEIESLSLPAVVLTTDDDNEGNAFRLGRYHLAVAKLRPEKFTFYSDLDHLRCQMGDKIRIVHDVPMFGVGSARIKAMTVAASRVTSITLDDDIDTGAVPYRFRVRSSNGTETAFAASKTSGNTWVPSGNVNVMFAVGDLVLVEETAAAPVDLLITGISHESELRAKITAVSAAPAVLTADTSAIPDYSPNITTPLMFGPLKPIILSARSGVDTAIVERDGSLTPRIGVQIGSIAEKSKSATRLQLRWRKAESTRWDEGEVTPYASEVFTGPLVAGNYFVSARTLNAENKTQGWVEAGSIFARSSATLLPAPSGWSAVVGVDTITLGGPALENSDLKEYRIYAATAASTALTLVGSTVTPKFIYRPPTGAGYTRYRVGAVDFGGVAGPLTGFISAIPTGVTANDLSNEVLAAIEGDKVAPGVPTSFAHSTTSVSDGVSRLVATWVAPPDADLDGYEVRIRVGTGNYVVIPVTSNRFEANLTPGQTYYMQVLALDRARNRSAYTTLVTGSAVGDTVAPSVPTGLAVSAGYQMLWLRWNRNTETDLHHYEVLEQPSATPAPVAGTAASFSTTGDQMARSGLPDSTTRHYWIRAVDTSGNKSAWSGRVQGVTAASAGVNADALAGLVNSTSFAAGLEAVGVVSALPSVAGYNGPKTVLLTTDRKLYRFTGTAWTKAVDGADLTANSVTTGAVAAAAIKTAQLDALAVTASKLAITDNENLLVGGSFTSDDTDFFTAGYPATINSNLSVTGGRSLALNKSTAASAVALLTRTDHLTPVKAGAEYWVETEARLLTAANSTNGFYARIQWYGQNRQVIGDLYGSIAENVGLTNQWQRFTRKITPPAGAYYAGMRLIITSSLNTDTTVLIDRVVMRRANAGELIVDGGITANMLSTEELITKTAQIKDAIITDAKILELSAAKLTAGTALAGSLTVDNRALSAVANAANLNDTMGGEAWNAQEGSAVLTDAFGLSASGNKYRFAGSRAYAVSPEKIVFSPERLYRVTCRIMRGTGTSGFVYIGLAGYAANGDLVNVSGANSTSSQFWNVINGIPQSSVPNAWTDYVGYVRGWGSTGFTGTGTIDNPKVMHPNVRFVAPAIVFNSGSGTTVMRLDNFKIEAVDEDAASVVNAGSVQINPGQILIEGGTSLDDWRGTNDKTSIKGGAIETQSLTTRQLSVGDFQNLIPNPTFANNMAGWVTYGGAGSSVVYYAGDYGVGLRINKGPNMGEVGARLTDFSSVDKYQAVRPGDKYSVTCLVRRIAGNSGGEVGIFARYTYSDGTTAGAPINGVTSGTPLAVNVNVSGTFTVPAKAVSVSFQAYYGTNGASENGSVLITNLEIRKLTGAVNIENGSITAEKFDVAQMNVSGLAVFGGELRSTDFLTGVSGWRIGLFGNAEFNQLIVRSSIVDGSVSAGSDSINWTSRQVGNNGTVLAELQTGPLMPNAFWHLAIFCQNRNRGRFQTATFTPAGPGSNGQPEYWIHQAYKITSQLVIQRRDMAGGVWGGWQPFHTFQEAEDDTWLSHREVFHISGQTENTAFRIINAERNRPIGLFLPMVESSVPRSETQPNYRNSGVTMKSVVK